MALRSKSLWNLLISLKALGRSAVSAFSSLNHFFHYKESISKDDVRDAKTEIVSKAFIFYQITSFKKFLRTSGTGGALASVLPRIRWLTSASVRTYFLIRILRASIVATMILCFSKRPLLTYLKVVKVMESMIYSTLLARVLGVKGSSPNYSSYSSSFY